MTKKERIAEVAKKYGMEPETRQKFDMRQREVFSSICWCVRQEVGGQENILQDYPEDSDSYQSAKAFLLDREKVVEFIKKMSRENYYEDGSCWWGGNVSNYVRHFNFCGSDFIDRAVRFRLEVEMDVNGLGLGAIRG